MFNLDPAKLLVIAVVAIILLGPDRLPQVARQAGNAWRSFTEFRHRMESEVRSSLPDLPSTSEIARLARSPSALLDHLSSMSGEDAGEDDDPAPAQDKEDGGSVGGGGPVVDGAGSNGSGAPVVHEGGAEEPVLPLTPVARPSRTAETSEHDTIVSGDPTLN
jgi:sec-independent protein translocase protein TatB